MNFSTSVLSNEYFKLNRHVCINIFTDIYGIDLVLFMQNFMKVPFKMPEIFPNTLGGGLEIWASIYQVLSVSINTVDWLCLPVRCQYAIAL